jgi:hypothetical protein
MAYPAILSETVSVGAVYDADGGEVTYNDGAKALSRKPGHFTPFTQRLSDGTGGALRMDVFAPGAPITSTGLNNPKTGMSTQHGTSQASPVTSGVILSMQQWYTKTHGGRLPSVDEIETWLRGCGQRNPMATVSGMTSSLRTRRILCSMPRLHSMRCKDAANLQRGRICFHILRCAVKL